MRTHALRSALLGALVLPAAVALWGCQELTSPGTSTSNTDPLTTAAIQNAVNQDNYTSDNSTVSDVEGGFGAMTTASADASAATPNAMMTQYKRIITSSTRTVTTTQTGNSASVSVVEDRSGTLQVRDVGSTIITSRPFADHGTRSIELTRFDNGRWMVTASTFLDRMSTSMTSPIGIAYVEFAPQGGVAARFSSPSDMLQRANWPTITSVPFTINVKLSGVPADGARVFLHERFAKDNDERRKFEMTVDATDNTLFHLTAFAPLRHFGEGPRDFRRLLTIDAFDKASLSTDATAIYNNHQWVVPIGFSEHFAFADNE